MFGVNFAGESGAFQGGWSVPALKVQQPEGVLRLTWKRGAKRRRKR